MREEYRKELEELETRMIKAEKFAQEVPLFSEKIIAEKLTGEEQYKKYVDSYKKLNSYNGVSRALFISDTSRSITNLNKQHNGYYWSLYVNTLGEYDSYAGYGLEDICKKVSVFFYDKLNSTFYCTDNEIKPLLETLNKWVINARKQAKKDRINKDIKDAKKIIEMAETNLKNLMEDKGENR